MKNVTIEQDHAELAKIVNFTFDLDRPGFVDYFISRTGLVIKDCAIRGENVRGPECGWIETSKEINHPTLAHFLIIRQKLQNCWNIFTEISKPSPALAVQSGS